MQDNIKEAIKLLRDNGYRVAKAPRPKQKKVGPTCVVHWADGNITRMSINTDDKKPDFNRGIRVSTSAWQTRQRAPIGKRIKELQGIIGKGNDYFSTKDRKEAMSELDRLMVDWVKPPNYMPPEIVDAYFSRDGEILAVWPESVHSFPVRGGKIELPEQERIAA